VRVVNVSRFDVAVLLTPVVAVVVMYTSVSNCWCRPWCTLSRFVHIVSVRGFDAVALITRLHYTCHCTTTGAVNNPLTRPTAKYQGMSSSEAKGQGGTRTSRCTLVLLRLMHSCLLRSFHTSSLCDVVTTIWCRQ
jgi:hypothetical protein